MRITLSTTARESFKLAKSWGVQSVRVRKLAKQRGAKIARTLDFVPYKRSDTLFLLGSGATILDMNEMHWQHVSSHDSLGFNFWLLHPFVPTFYVGEVPRHTRGDAYLHALKNRATNYCRTFMVFKYRQSLVEKYELIRRVVGTVSIAKTLNVPGNNRRGVSQWLRILQSSGILTHSDVFFSRTASIDWLTLFAAKLGYKAIVLCGVDLNNTNYFFEHAPGNYTQQGFLVPESGQLGAIHKTSDPERCYGGVPIQEVLQLIQDIVLSPRGIALFIADSRSALYPQLPLYPWPELTVRRQCASGLLRFPGHTDSR